MESTFELNWEYGEPPPAVPHGLEEKAKAYVLNELKPRFDDYSSSQSQDQNRLLKSFKDFLMLPETRAKPGASPYRFLMPTVYNAVRMTWARVLDGLLGAPKLASISPFGMIESGFLMDYEELEFRARLAESAFNALLDLGNARMGLALSSLDGLVYGRAWGKAGWKMEGQADGFGGLTVHKEYPVAIRVSGFNAFKDPHCGMDLSHSRFVFEVLESSYEESLALEKAGLWVRDAAKKFEDLQNASSNTYLQQARQLRKQDTTTARPSGMFEAVEAHSYWDPDGNGQPTKWVHWFVLQSGELLGCRELPFDHGEFPYTLGTTMPAPDMAFGIGLPEALHGITQASSSTVNQLSANIASMNLRHIILRGAIDRVALSKSVPNGIIETEDMSAWKPVQGQAMPADVWQFLNFWEGLQQQTSGVTPLTMAMRAASTAYGTSAVQANQQTNMDLVTTVLSLTYFGPILRQLFANTQQFLDLSVIVDVHGDGGKKLGKAPVSREDIQGNFKVEPFDMRLFGKKLQRAQASQALLSQLVQLQLPANYQWIVQQIFEDLELGDADQAFKGNIYNPLLMQAMARQAGAAGPQMQMGGGAPTGAPGQWYPNSVEPVSPDMDASRPQIRPFPGGGQPASLEGQLPSGQL